MTSFPTPIRPVPRRPPVAYDGGCDVLPFSWLGPRVFVQTFTAKMALNMVRLRLMKM